MEKKLGNWFFKTDEQRPTKLWNNWISALGLPILGCTTFSPIKCAPGTHGWAFVSATWLIIAKKKTTFCNGLSQEMELQKPSRRASPAAHNHWLTGWCWLSWLLKGLFSRPIWKVTVISFREGWRLQSALKWKEVCQRTSCYTRQCPSPYCILYNGSPQEYELGSHRISSSQSTFGAIWFSPFWTVVLFAKYN